MSSSEYSTGEQYHLGTSPGDIAPYILLCGDPARAFKIALYFDSKLSFLRKILWKLLSVKFIGPAIVGIFLYLFFTDVFKTHREFVTLTGKYKGVPVSAIATGIGTDNNEIAVIEAALCAPKGIPLTFIRVGSCGAIKEGIEAGDLIVSLDAVRRENTSSFYLPPEIERIEGAPVVAHTLMSVAKHRGYAHHSGTTCSTSSFYAGQGREVPGFPITEEAKKENLFPKLLEAGVLNFEMETSLLFTLAKISERPMRAGSICAVYAERWSKEGFDTARMYEAERRCIKTALGSVVILAHNNLE